jgi:hypothetical protein
LVDRYETSDGNGSFPLYIDCFLFFITDKIFYLTWIWVTWCTSIKTQVLFTLRWHLGSLPLGGGGASLFCFLWCFIFFFVLCLVFNVAFVSWLPILDWPFWIDVSWLTFLDFLIDLSWLTFLDWPFGFIQVLFAISLFLFIKIYRINIIMKRCNKNKGKII